jgi:hypothetical protein
MYSTQTPRSIYSRVAARSLYPYTGAPVVSTVLHPGSTFRYTSYWPKGMHGVQLADGMGQLPITAALQVIPLAVSLFGGKKHYSPWGFLYDDYPLHIGENEQTIVTLKNAIAQYTGAQQITPPPQVNRGDWQQSLSVMKQIVPQYISGQESALASNNRSLNESGGGYERTYAAQAALIPKLQAQYNQLQVTAKPAPGQPASGSPMAPAPYGGPAPPSLIAPSFSTPAYYSPALMPQLQPGSTLQPYQTAPSNISITTPGQMTADMFGGATLQGMLPYIIGGIGLFAILMMQGRGGETRTVYRSVPRRK